MIYIKHSVYAIQGGIEMLVQNKPVTVNDV